jgi:CRP/FNR family transcriptional regulator
MAADIQLLKQSPTLQDLPDTVLDLIVSRTTLLNIPRDTRLFDYGSQCELLPLVLEGSIRVFKRSENGREISLYRVNSDQMCLITLGCLLGGHNYEAVGISETDVRAIGIPQGLFIELMAGQAAFRDRIFLFFTERLTGLMNLVEEITFNKLDQRLADVLLKHGPVIDLSHQALADELGSVREMISRLLKQFQDDGWVCLSRKKIEITNPEALQSLIKGV